MGDSKYLDIVKSLNLPKVDVAQTPSAGQSKYSDIARQIGVEQRKEKLPGAGAAEDAGETAGVVASAMLTPFAFERGGAALLYLYDKVFGQPGQAEWFSRLAGVEAMDKQAQAAGGVRDTVGRTLSGMTAATTRGLATTLEMVTPDSIDPFGKVEGFARGMATTSAVTSDTYTDKITAAVTNGVANIALGVFAAPIAAPAFFFQGAGGAANEYDNAFVEGKLTTKDGIYRPSGKYIAALKGGVIEAATEWFGAKMAKNIAKTRWGRDMTVKMRDMNPAMKFATGLGVAYAMEGGEEGAASLAYSFTRKLQGEEFRGFGTAIDEAIADAFYGGFGGAGAHPFIAVAEASQAKIMRDRISSEIRKANGPFSDEKFWDAMPRATVDSLKGMTPQQRDAELQTANSNYHQANADRQVGATAVNNAAATLEKAQKQLKTASKSKDQAKIDAAQKAVDAAQAAYDTAFANQATLGAELLAARTRLITIAAFNARNTPVIEKTAADVLSELKLGVSSATTESDSAAEAQIRELGYDIQFFDSTDPDTDPAFYSPSAPNTIFLKSGMTREEMLDGVVFAHHEAMHIIQATDGDLYSAMRKAFDEQSVVEAGVEYFNDKLRRDDRLAQSAASSLARQMDTGPTMPTTVGGAIEQRAGRTLLQAEGQAKLLEKGVRELLRSGKAPGFLGELIVKMGLRGRQAATALRVRKMMLDAAAKRGKVSSAVGKPVALTEFGTQIEEAKGVLRAQKMMETPPKAPAAPTPAAAPAAAAAAPSAAPVPPSASAAVVTASGMTPAEAAAAQTPDFKAMVNLAVNSLRKTDKKWAEGKRLYPIAEQMERDPAALSPEDRKIGEELRAEMTSQFGKDYAVLWARARQKPSAEPTATTQTTGRTLVAKAIKALGLTEQEVNSTVIDLMTGKPGRDAFQKNDIGRLPAVVKFLHDRRLASGLKVLDINNDDDRETISRLLAAEAIGAINSAGSALEWYDSTIRNTLAQAALKYPELDTDPRARLAFLLSMAISSQGLNVESNLNFTMRQYGEYRKTVDPATGIGQFRTIGEGKHSGAQANNFRIANSMIKSIGPDQMIRFLRTSFTAKELTDAGLEIGGELKSEQVLGSAIFGPKIGFGFYSNLDGNFDPVTMDMWFMRTIGRLAGTLPAFERGKFDKQVARLRKSLTQRGSNGIFPNSIDPNLVARAKDKVLGDDPVIELARAVAKLHERDFTANRAEYDNKTRVQSKMVLASKSIVQSLDKPRDAPKSGGERRALRDVVRRAVAKVSSIYGKNVANAAFQALIWYPEQELYRALGVRLKVTSQDYSGAIRKLLKTEGFNDGQLDAAIAAAQSRSGAARQVAGGAVAGTGGVAGAVAVPARTLTQQQRDQFLAGTPVSIAKSWNAPEPDASLNPLQAKFFKQFAAIGFVRQQQRGAYSQNWRYEREGDQDGKKSRVLKVARKYGEAGKKGAKKIALPYISTIAAGDAIEILFKRQKLLAPKFHELKATKQTAAWFHDQITAFKAGNEHGAAVAAYPASDYMGMRLFTSRNGQSGFAIKPNGDIVSVFSEKGGGRAILEAALASGGNRLDCFDTVLPVIYGAHGFKAVARIPWNDEYKPDDWKYETFQKFSGGRPDVVFMVHDPKSMAQYQPLDGPTVAEYDDGVAAQDAALAKVSAPLSARLRVDTTKEITDAFVAEKAKFADIIVALQDAIKATVGIHRVKERTSKDDEFGRVLDLSESVRVDTYENVRANWSNYRDSGRGSMELKESQLPSSMQRVQRPNEGGLVFAHEMMHAATALRIDSYVEKYTDKKVKEAGHDRYSDLGMKVAKRWQLQGVSGAKYIENLERYSTDPDVDPAFKELVDCFLESAKSVPDQYERMTKGKRTTPSVRFNNALAPGRIFVRQSERPSLRPEIASTLSAEAQRDLSAPALELVVEVGGEEFVIDRRPPSKANVIEETAAALKAGKPVLRDALYMVSIESWSSGPAKVIFRQNGRNITIPGFEPVHEYSGGGLVNKDNSGDAMSEDGGLYAFGNLHEFVAEAINKPQFQNILRAIPSKGRGSGSMFSRLMQALRRFLGIEESVPMSMLDDLMNLTEEMARTDIVAAIGQAPRRAAVPGEVAIAPKQKALTLQGFPVVGGLTDVFKYQDGSFTLSFRLPGVTIDTITPVGNRDQPAKVVLHDTNKILVDLKVELVDGKWTIWRGNSDGFGSERFGELYSPSIFPSSGDGATSIDGKPFGKTKSAAIKDFAEIAKRMAAISSKKQIDGAEQLANGLRALGYTNVSFEDKRGQPYTRSDEVTVTRLSARRQPGPRQEKHGKSIDELVALGFEFLGKSSDRYGRGLTYRFRIPENGNAVYAVPTQDGIVEYPISLVRDEVSAQKRRRGLDPSISLAARRQPTAERRDIAASVVLDVARQRLQQLLDSLPANQATWSEADRAAVATARQNVLDAARDLKRKPSRADAASLAYQIGRREGLLSGEIRGQTVAKREEKREAERLVREERNKQRVEARAKRMKMRSEFRDRVAGLMLEIESAAATNDELRNRIKVMRKYEKARKAVAARKAESAVLKAWIKGLYKGRAAGKAEGIAEAKQKMTDIRKAAVQVIATLPPKLRGKYVNAVATMKTAAGINKIARRVVQDLAMAEAIETVAAINRMEKRIKKVGLRAETRTDLRDDLSAARSMLASGRKRMLPFTDTADLASRTEAARRLLESAVQRFDVERAEYRDARDLRADEAAADAAALGATLATMPKLKQGRLSSMAPKRGVLRDIFATIGNADIYTLMQAIEGGSSGVLGKMWAGFSEAKGNMTLDRKRIDERIDAALRGVGYAGYDGYATNAAGLYGESSAESVTVTLGGNPMTITVDQMLHLAAFDDDTVALLTDETDTTGTPGAPIVFSTYRNSPKVYMTQQEFAAIRANLTNGQRQLIDEMKAILEDEIRARAFDIHFQIHGRQPDIVPGYFPRQRLGDEVGEIVDVNALPSAVMNTMLSNAGFLQQRVAAKSTLVVGGMMRTMDKHLDESLRLIHLSMPLRYAMTVLKNSEVKAGIESTMGDGGNDMIRKLVLNGVGLSGKAQGGLIEGINANISGALITLNPKTWLRQLGGAFRLISEMPVGAWAKGVAQMAVMTPAQRRDMAREIESMNGYFYDRHRRSQVGIFANVLGDPNTARDRWAASLSSSARSMSALGESVAAGQFARAARDLREGVLPISRVLKSADGVLRMVDRQIMLAAFLGMRADVMASNPSMTPAEVNIAAAKLAEQAFRKTQNVSDPLDDTVYAAQQKFSQGIGRLMFPFSSDPLKGYNQIRRAAASGDPALIGRTAAGVAGNMALSAAVNPLWTAAGIAIANALGGGGDEEDEEMIKQMAMEQEFSYIAPRIASDAAAATFGYLGMLGGGIVDGALGSAERADDVMEPLVVRFFGDISQYAAKGDLPSLSATGLQMAGVPVVAPVTTVTGVLKKAAPSDRKLLEYYRKLDKAGQLNAAQRQRLNVLAARERIRLAQERRAKQLQE